ncbi:hypothetical protein AB0F45_27570 [Streptomyces achromogenes]|uniref:hypothetical protein n=1 Tax=Streptomyces achromogenes TaxID=67255 RepID=UPI0033EE30D5
MTILAGSEPIPASVAAIYASAAARMHVVPRGVQPGVSEFGETLPSGQAEEEGCDRVETRLSLYLSADDLLAGFWDATALWDSGPEVIEQMTPDQLRWHIISSLVMAGGPGSPRAARLADEARACGRRGEPEVQRLLATGCRAIQRAFGLSIA